MFLSVRAGGNEGTWGGHGTAVRVRGAVKESEGFIACSIERREQGMSAATMRQVAVDPQCPSMIVTWNVQKQRGRVLSSSEFCARTINLSHLQN